MKMSQKTIRGLIMALAIIFCSGLAFSQDNFSPAKAIEFFVSLYAPYDGTKNGNFSMCFGNELHNFTKKAVQAASKIPERTFLK